jgi:hypothetical protein
MPILFCFVGQAVNLRGGCLPPQATLPPTLPPAVSDPEEHNFFEFLPVSPAFRDLFLTTAEGALTVP